MMSKKFYEFIKKYGLYMYMYLADDNFVCYNFRNTFKSKR